MEEEERMLCHKCKAAGMITLWRRKRLSWLSWFLRRSNLIIIFWPSSWQTSIADRSFVVRATSVLIRTKHYGYLALTFWPPYRSSYLMLARCCLKLVELPVFVGWRVAYFSFILRKRKSKFWLMFHRMLFTSRVYMYVWLHRRRCRRSGHARSAKRKAWCCFQHVFLYLWCQVLFIPSRLTSAFLNISHLDCFISFVISSVCVDFLWSLVVASTG